MDHITWAGESSHFGKRINISIQRYFDQFKSHILIEESSDKETLGYLLESEVANFSIAIKEIQRNREMEPPF